MEKDGIEVAVTPHMLRTWERALPPLKFSLKRTRFVLNQQLHNERRNLTSARFAAHGAAVALGDGLDKCQPKADTGFALADARQAVEGFKNAFTLGLGKTRPAVMHLSALRRQDTLTREVEHD